MNVPFKEILILPKEKYLFLLSAKCASTSIRIMVLDHFHYRNPSDKLDWGLKYIRNLDKLEKMDSYLSIMLTRNPYSRIVSLYKHKIVSNLHKTFDSFGFYRCMKFEKFVDLLSTIPDEIADPHFTSQTMFYDYIFPKYIIKLEDFNLQLWNSLGLPKLKKRNKSNDLTDWEDFYDDKMKEKIYQRYQRDFEILDYKK